MTFQDLILTLQSFWKERGCVLVQPYDVEKGAGTFNPATFLRALGPEPFATAYPEPCRRPTDGRYGDNPIRMQHYYQFQVLLKPSPADIVDQYLESLKSIGITPEEHDLRFVHDDWETAALGAWGLGWEVWCDGTEITQFTYFQQVGGLELTPISGEITYGLERICMFLQGVDSVFDIRYNDHLTYGDLFHQNEVQFSAYNFEIADTGRLLDLFNIYEKECAALCEAQKPNPAVDYAMKASHAFNLLDARGAISVKERQAYVLRIRQLAKNVAESWLAERKRLEFPLLKKTANFSSGRSSPETKTALSGEPRTPEAKSPEPPANLPDKLPMLVELGIEEMPAKVFNNLESNLRALWEKLSTALELEASPIAIYTTPRRIALYSEAVTTRQPDRKLELKGPPLSVAKDKDGNWTRAALGFAKKNNLEPVDLSIREFDNGSYVWGTVLKKGRSAVDILAELIPQLFSKIPWYKTMRWGDGTMTPFVRPVQWLVALLGDNVIPTSFAGCEAGSQSRGHRFLHNKPVEVSPESYLQDLEKAYVMADAKARTEKIRNELHNLTGEQGLAWREDENLLHQVACLVEYPVPVLGSFKKEYLKIPEPVLVSEMREHQKYFAVKKPDGGLDNHFIAISNMLCKSPEKVKAGYENVLTSRLKDAEFFLAEDRKKTLEQRREDLRNLTFEKSLGTMYDKTERLVALAGSLGSRIGLSKSEQRTAEQIAALCKSDLTSAMVFEFPELQGVVGRHYAEQEAMEQKAAKREAYSPILAGGIEEHYYPVSAASALPTAPEGALVALSDRLDNLVGFFGIGRQPTGSADPYALRRSTLGVLALILGNKWDVDLKVLIDASETAYKNQEKSIQHPGWKDSLLEFIKQRLIVLLHEGGRPDVPSGLPKDLLQAVLRSRSSWTRVLDFCERARAMHDFRREPEFANTAVTFKRVSNILDPAVSADPDPKRFVAEEEKTLYAQLQEVAPRIQNLMEEKQYTTALHALAGLRQPVDALFEKVLMNDPDPDVRQNRHAMLRVLRDVVLQIADFTALQSG